MRTQATYDALRAQASRTGLTPSAVDEAEREVNKAVTLDPLVDAVHTAVAKQ